MEIGNGQESVSISKSVRVTGTGAIAANLLKVVGHVIILSQYAIIESITRLNNATGVYATRYDGVNEDDLTADGVVLSGFTVNSYFTKDKVAAQPYTAVNGLTGGVVEVTDDRFAGRPFTAMQTNGVDTFLRFYLTTTDNPVDFTMGVYFEYIPLGKGSSLSFL